MKSKKKDYTNNETKKASLETLKKLTYIHLVLKPPFLYPGIAYLDLLL